MPRIIVFIHQNSGKVGKCLHEAIRNSGIQHHFDLYQTVVELKDLLQSPLPYSPSDLFVLLADTRDRLKQCRAIERFLLSRWILLIGPDNERATRISGACLQPRFLFSLPEVSFDIVSAILNKKCENLRMN